MVGNNVEPKFIFIKANYKPQPSLRTTLTIFFTQVKLNDYKILIKNNLSIKIHFMNFFNDYIKNYLCK